MSEAIATQNDSAALLERVVIGGDLSKLSPADRLRYYSAVCESVGLNPLTRPFEYIHLSGRLVLYAKRDATDQLRKRHGVSITRLERELVEGIYAVTAYATDSTGRTDTAVGAVSIEGLRGESKANAMMKAETKSKRRVTLSICGLGMLDETEVDSIPGAVVGEPQQPTAAQDELGMGDDSDPVVQERKAMLSRVSAAAGAKKMTAKVRAELWHKHCGNAGPDDVDPAALHELLKAVEAA